MKIGLLLCDDVRSELQKEHKNYPEMFAALLKKQQPDLELVIYRVLDNKLPAKTDECDGWLISGSRHGANDDFEWISALEDFIRQLHKEGRKLVGICFGHQVMAQALGGKVVESDKGWGVGMSENSLLRYKAWMDKGIGEFNLLVSHKDQVVELPESTEILAASDFCPYYMLQYGENFMSVQGHPEFSKEYSAALMDSRRDSIPEKVLNMGMESLIQKPDSDLLGKWIIQFLK
ncbi:GMP synthase [Endozoicomonas sp. OPT23]|uniref:glutamine amidotransferase-related protein n=1 Tax=Endozoicomonas sp. OPT23 TaxID=2072845 RepID=UPI00129A144C|nr:GMP synthase [Endozoicomonas sp. OPT23]MRI31765.1 GMP synthase [Endozoicomonas sp. OPT23]